MPIPLPERNVIYMGFFTWTDARYPVQSLDKIPRSKIVKYDHFAKIVCPDDTEIIEQSYDGYGVFGDKDVYELVVDWNRQDLKSIFNRKAASSENKLPSFPYLHRAADMLADGVPDNAISAYMEVVFEQGKIPPYLVRDWKRSIGIEIACNNNASLPYPIKITMAKRKHKYADLHPSIVTQ